MLILLPILVFLELYSLAFKWRSRKETADIAVRSSLIFALGGIGLISFLGTEGLGLFNAINRTSLAFFWGSLAIVLGVSVWRLQVLKGFQSQFPRMWGDIHLARFEKFILVCMGIYLAVLLVIAAVSPPNNNDSLQYHLPRILHWIENGSLRFFTVAYFPQLYNPPGAEILLLQNYLLVGGDHLLNLQQWFFMLSSVIVASLIAKTLGAGRMGQWLAAIYLLCLPIGILESTSTQNDYVLTFWILGLVYIALQGKGQRRGWLDILWIGALAGLAMWTKIPAYSFVAVILIWLTLSNIRIEGLRRTVLNSFTILSLLFAINLPGWVRNITVFGNPLGDADAVSTRAPTIYNPTYFLISPLQHLSLNFGTPLTSINELNERAIVQFCDWLGGTDCTSEEKHEWGFRIIGISNHEDSAGNLLHVVIFTLTIILFIVKRKKVRNAGGVSTYLFVVIAAFLLHSWLITWGMYWVRLQLPLFAMGAAFVAMISDTIKPAISRLVMITLLFLGMPWLLLNRTRPIISMTPEVTLVNSIFVETRDTLYFANFPEWQGQVREITHAAVQSECKAISLRIDSRDPEYYFTHYLDITKTGIHFEVESSNPSLQKYKNMDFAPCAIICSICGEDPDPTGLLLAEKVKGMTLYLSPEYYYSYMKNDH